MNKRNLALLAEYLFKLPENYGHFEMRIYSSQFCEPYTAYRAQECGTAACAVGHATIVKGIPAPLDWEDYSDFSERVFEISADCRSEKWDYMFASQWAKLDNTPSGAAQRITHILVSGKAPPCYWMSGMNCIDEVEAVTLVKGRKEVASYQSKGYSIADLEQFLEA